MIKLEYKLEYEFDEEDESYGMQLVNQLCFILKKFLELNENIKNVRSEITHHQFTIHYEFDEEKVKPLEITSQLSLKVAEFLYANTEIKKGRPTLTILKEWKEETK